MIGFFKTAFRQDIAKRAIVIALVVGTIIAMINYFDKIFAGTLTSTDVAKIIVTFFVPYAVSTVSSVMAINQTSKS